MSDAQGAGLAKQLAGLNDIVDLLHEASNVRETLPEALARLLDLMQLETGWIFLEDPSAQDRRYGPGFVLAAHHNLPSELAPSVAVAWNGACECQRLCLSGVLDDGYNVVQCSRLAAATKTAAGRPPMDEESTAPAIHASAPLRAGTRTIGILNVLAPDRAALTPDALALLTNVGRHMGVAMERARLLIATQAQHTRELTALLEFSNRLLGHADLDGLVGDLVDELRRLLKVDACALLLPDPSGRTLVFRAASGWRYDPVAAGHFVAYNETSGPGRVMLWQRAVIIEDMMTDPQGIVIPDWSNAEGFRGHCVVPLLAEGRSIGALSVDMRHPHAASDQDVRLLQLMANQAALALETARLQEEAVRQQRLAEQLEVARQIQLSLLPEDAPEVPGWGFAAAYRSAQVVGGDFYDYFYLPGTPLRMGIVIADVADKGVPAALFMALSRTVIRTSALGGRRPATVLERANNIILGDSQSDMFLTACYVVLELASGRVVIANGGHPRPLLWRAETGEGAELKTRGVILGAFEQIVLEERDAVLELGDVMLLYSDGLTDATNAMGEYFGEQRLQAVFIEHARETVENLIRAVLDAIDVFTGGEAQYDDMTLVAVRRQPIAPQEAIPADWTRANFPAQRMPAYVRRRAV